MGWEKIRICNSASYLTLMVGRSAVKILTINSLHEGFQISSGAKYVFF